MTERELLTRAAEAAGLRIEYWAQEDYPVVGVGEAQHGWNPLKFNSDALALAVRMEMDVFVRAGRWTEAVAPMGEPYKAMHGVHGDAETATRFAITMAALGKPTGNPADWSGRMRAKLDKNERTIDMEFQDFPKMERLTREVIVTEKIDGTNAQIFIAEDGTMLAGSRTRWITPADDNFGFAAWVEAHRDELLTLGPGRHFGEWWGAGIQRRYGLSEKRFSLFNVQRWALHGTIPKTYPTADPRVKRTQDVLPPCCGLVPVLYQGPFDTAAVDRCIEGLRLTGSVAAPGFMKPEGVVVFHTAGNVGFKKTVEKDEVPKALAALQVA